MNSSGARLPIMVAVMSIAMIVYMLMTTKIALVLISSGIPSHILFGVGIFLMALVGFWGLYATLREGLIYQRLSKMIAQQHQELDISGYECRPSGKLTNEDAQKLFLCVQAEVDEHPHQWQCWYRLGRAYQYAGDSPRARKAFHIAYDLYRHPPQG